MAPSKLEASAYYKILREFGLPTLMVLMLCGAIAGTAKWVADHVISPHLESVEADRETQRKVINQFMDRQVTLSEQQGELLDGLVAAEQREHELWIEAQKYHKSQIAILEKLQQFWEEAGKIPPPKPGSGT